MNNNHRLHSFSDSCVFMFKKSLGSVVILAALTAFAQAETISLSGGQTDSSAHSLADEGATPAVTSSNGNNKSTGSLTLTGDSTFKIDSGSTLTLTQQLASNDYGSTRAITLYKTGAGTLKVDGKRILVGNVYIKEGTLSLNATGTNGSFLSNNIITVDGASAVLDGAGAIIYYSYNTGKLNILNGGTVHNSKSDSHMTIPYPVYMNYGKMTATGSGAASFGNFILDNVIYVTGDTRNSIDASRVLLRNSGGKFNVAENAKLTINSDIFGSTVGLKKEGAGELSLTGVSSYTLTTEISAGTLALDAANAIVSTSSVINNGAITMSAAQQLNNLTGSGTINNGGKTLTLNNSSASTFSGVISGSGAVTKKDSSTLTLSGANTYTGATTISEGTLRLTENGTLGAETGAVTVTPSADDASATLEFAHNTKQTVSNVISGTGTIKKTGTGELVLNNASGFKGEVKVTDGTLTLTRTGETGTFAKESVITVEGSTAVLSGSGTVLGYGAGAVSRLNLYNGGSLNVSSDDGHITVGGALYFNNGKLTTTTKNAAGDTYGNFIIDNGIYVTGSTENEIAVSMITIRSDKHTKDGGYFDIAEGARLTVSAVIRPNSAIPVTKDGLGELVFKAANTYSGNTVINAGTIRLVENGTLGSATSEITVKSSANDMWATLEFAQTSGEVNFSRNIVSEWYTGAAAGGEKSGRIIKSGAATLNLSGNINRTGFETTAGITNIGTADSFNTNKLRVGYFDIDKGAVVNYYGSDSGSLTICAGGYSFVGKTGNGTLNINKGKAATETDKNNAGNLKLFIGGETNADNASVGTVNIASGVTYTAGSQEINVGSWGTGYLNIYGTMTTDKLLRVAEHSGGSAGTITVYDGGSLTSNTELFVGSYGEGLVDVKNGGSVTAKGSVTVGSNGNGTILVENGGSFESTVNMKLAALAGQSGTITVQKGGYLKSLDIQVGSNGTGLVDNYGQIVVTDTVKIGRDGGAGSGTVNVYKDATLSANVIYPGVTMPGTLNINGGMVTANGVALHGRGTNATGAVTITNGGSLTTDFVQFGNVNYKTYAVDTTLTLDDGTLSVVNVNYPRDGAYTNKVNATVNLGKGTVITGAAPGVESIWWKAVHINLTSANGTNFQVDAGKQALINSTMSGSGKLIKTGEGTLQINAAQGAVDIYSLVVSSGRLDMKEYFTGALEVGLADADNSTVIFSPGNSVGSLEISGDFTLHKGATLLIEQEGSRLDTLSATTFFIESDSILDLPVDSLQPGLSTPIIQSTNAFGGDLATDAFWNGLLTPASAYYWNLKVVNGNTVYASVDANAVPEPSTWALLVLGAMGLLYWRKRK